MAVMPSRRSSAFDRRRRVESVIRALFPRALLEGFVFGAADFGISYLMIADSAGRSGAGGGVPAESAINVFAMSDAHDHDD